jgi:multidrug efflux pump
VASSALVPRFAITLSAAIAVSMVVSLTTTPMMCAHLLKEQKSHGWLYETSERGFNWIVSTYARTLSGVLRWPAITLLVLLGTIALNVFLFIRVPKGFFPQADGGRLTGSIQADQDTSPKCRRSWRFTKIVMTDPRLPRQRVHRRRWRWRGWILEYGAFLLTAGRTRPAPIRSSRVCGATG